jgi:hypothetical protein
MAVKQWRTKLWYSIARPNLRRIARWAKKRQGPVERLRFLRERMETVPAQYLLGRQTRTRSILAAAAAAILAVAAILLWRAI